MLLVNKIKVPLIFDITFGKFSQWIDKEYCIKFIIFIKYSSRTKIVAMRGFYILI